MVNERMDTISLAKMSIGEHAECDEKHHRKGMRRDGPKDREVTAVGFEPTQLRTGA